MYRFYAIAIYIYVLDRAHNHIHMHISWYIPVNGRALLVTAHAHPSFRRQALTCTSHSSPTVNGPLIVTFVNSVSMVTLWVDVHK